MGARGMFDEAKHPRGSHGRFGSGGRMVGTKVGRSTLSKSELANAAKSGKSVFPGHNSASATTLAYASRKSGRKRAVTRFRPAVYTDKTGKRTEVIGEFRYSPRGADLWRSVGRRPKPGRR